MWLGCHTQLHYSSYQLGLQATKTWDCAAHLSSRLPHKFIICPLLHFFLLYDPNFKGCFNTANVFPSLFKETSKWYCIQLTMCKMLYIIYLFTQMFTVEEMRAIRRMQENFGIPSSYWQMQVVDWTTQFSPSVDYVLQMHYLVLLLKLTLELEMFILQESWHQSQFHTF